eukprot:1158839-Pelagomonas_calceolata.AAC.9
MPKKAPLALETFNTHEEQCILPRLEHPWICKGSNHWGKSNQGKNQQFHQAAKGCNNSSDDHQSPLLNGVIISSCGLKASDHQCQITDWQHAQKNLAAASTRRPVSQDSSMQSCA